MRILIATGIYPPDIGGPAQYAKNLAEALKKAGHTVAVKFFRFENKLPTGIRHLYYFFRILPAVRRCEVVFAFDTFSCALPAILAAKIFGKKFIVRTGGDFLWESYVERTGNEILLREFYGFFLEVFDSSEITQKERFIFKLTKWILQNATCVVFSTEWQKEIWGDENVYNVSKSKIVIIENYYGQKEESFAPEHRNFLAGTRPLKWKNDARLAEAFGKVKAEDESIVYDNETKPFSHFMEVLARAYAVILVSLGDISPNLILDAIRHNKPFIVTKETGLYERIKPCAIFVDPENTDEIAEKIRWLSQPENYEAQKKKVEAFDFLHTWEQIAEEFLTVAKKS